jgi:hypothetical protein
MRTRPGDVGERRSPKALCGEAFEHEDRAHHGRGDDEREVERGRRDKEVEDACDRGPMIAGDGDGQGAAEEVLLRDGVDESDGEHQGCRSGVSRCQRGVEGAVQRRHPTGEEGGAEEGHEGHAGEQRGVGAHRAQRDQALGGNAEATAIVGQHAQYLARRPLRNTDTPPGPTRRPARIKAIPSIHCPWTSIMMPTTTRITAITQSRVALMVTPYPSGRLPIRDGGRTRRAGRARACPSAQWGRDIRRALLRHAPRPRPTRGAQAG